MSQTHYWLFETPLGPCGIAWKEDEGSSAPPAVSYLQLPEATAAKTEARIVEKTGASRAINPAPYIAEVIRRLNGHFQGEAQDFRDLALDLDGVGDFARQVYDAARKVLPGQIRSYGEIAKAVRRPAAARAVGQALGQNPIAVIIPCHRVVGANRKPGGFSAHGGWATKRRLLALEGVEF